MHHLYLFLGCFLVHSTLSASTSSHFQRSLTADYRSYHKLVRRTSPKGSPKSQKAGRKSPTWSTSSGSPTASPPKDRPGGVASSSRIGRLPKGEAVLAQRRPRNRFPLGMVNGPVKARGRPLSQHDVEGSTGSREPSPDSLRAISGHPTSALVVGKGPATIQTTTGSGRTDRKELSPGRIGYLNVQDKFGAFAVGEPKVGGSTTVAATGNSAAGHAAAGAGHGFVQADTHDGRGDIDKTVESHTRFRKHISGDGTGRVKAAVVAHMHGPGQTTAVGTKDEVPHPSLPGF